VMCILVCLWQLVEWARALLKSLLDVAVESVFEAHLKVHIYDSPFSNGTLFFRSKKL